MVGQLGTGQDQHQRGQHLTLSHLECIVKLALLSGHHNSLLELDLEGPAVHLVHGFQHGSFSVGKVVDDVRLGDFCL